MPEHQDYLGLSYPGNLMEQVTYQKCQDSTNQEFREKYLINTSDLIQQQRYFHKI